LSSDEENHPRQFEDPSYIEEHMILDGFGTGRGSKISGAGTLLMLDAYLKHELVFGVACAKKAYNKTNQI
jgi:hypothetical protein